MASSSQARPLASGLMLKCMSAEENEFLAKETLVTVTSGVNHGTFKFISGHFGPLQAGLPCELPLWLALQLRKSEKVTIESPAWMSVAELERNLQNERTNASFEPMPYYYIEVAKLLLAHARVDIASPDQVSTLLQDLQNIRMDRVREGILSMASNAEGGEYVTFATLPNVCSAELSAVKRFMAESMGVFQKLFDTPEYGGEGGDEGGGGGGGGGGDGGARLGGRQLRRFRVADNPN